MDKENKSKISTNKYCITFDSENEADVEALFLLENEIINKPVVPTRMGYVFAGWFDNKNLNGSPFIFPYQVTADLKLYAKWEKAIDSELIVNLNYDGYEVVGVYNKNIRKLVIPTTYQEKPITKIAYGALGGCDKLESLEIPFIGQANLSGTNDHFGYIFGSEANEFRYQAGGYYLPKTLKEVVVSKANTISALTFYNCRSIIKLSITNYTQTIGAAAFLGCDGLNSISLPFVGTKRSASPDNGQFKYVFGNIPQLLTEVIITDETRISDDAFNSCTNITSITLPNSLVAIGMAAFCDCTSLVSINIPHLVQVISPNTFYHCNSLVKVSLPKNLNLIDDYSFYGCSSLEEIIMPNNVVRIGDYAFCGCSSINNFQIAKHLEVIGNYAFKDCSGLTEIVIPNLTIRIGERSFLGCNSLTKLTTPFIGNKQNIEGMSGSLKAIFGIIPKSLSEVIVTAAPTISSNAFSDCDSITRVVIFPTTTEIKAGAFYNCSSLVSITIPFVGQTRNATDAAACFGSIFGIIPYSGCYDANGYCLPKGLREVIITDTNTIGVYAFYNCSSITKIIIPDKTTTIKDSAFAGCRNLGNLLLPDGVENIERKAFSDCSSLTSLIIPKSVVAIEMGALCGCSNLKVLTIPFIGHSRVTNEFNGCFGYIFGSSSYQGSYNANRYAIPLSLKQVIITDTTTIGKYAFYDCSSITEIVIPNDVVTIAENAFCGCLSLTTINLSDQIKTIASYTFLRCISLTKIVIPEKVRMICDYAFSGSGLTELYIPSNVIKIDDYAFSRCDSLTKITVASDNLTYDSRNSINAIVESATNKLILGCQTTIIPNSVLALGDCAFYGANKLAGLVIPSSVTKIGSSTFFGCSNLVIFTTHQHKPLSFSDNWNNNQTVYWLNQWEYDENKNPCLIRK